MSKKIKFVRIGGLSPVVQKGYTTDPELREYHTPPARKGFYAFIHPYFEPFLLGGPWSKLGKKNKQEKFEYLKDVDGNKIKLYVKDCDWNVFGNENLPTDNINPEVKKYLVKGKQSAVKRNSDGTDISGKFWTQEIRDAKGDFVNCYLIKKKSIKVFEHRGELWHHLNNKAVKHGDIINRVGYWIKTDYDVFVRAFEQDKIDCIKNLKKNNTIPSEMISVKNIYSYIAKDHLEVFIERIK